MKSIQIITDTTYFTVNDKDDRPVPDYTRSLTELLQSKNISILHTSEHSVIIRPSKIVAAIVTEVAEEQLPTEEIPPQIESVETPENREQNSEMPVVQQPVEEDIITDAE